AAVLAAIKALEIENTVIQSLTEASIVIAAGKATVTLAKGVTAEVIVNVAADPIEVAKQAFLEASTTYDPSEDSDIYDYSFDGKTLSIDFNFAEYVLPDGNVALEVIDGIMEAAGGFLVAVFHPDYGNAQKIVINMGGVDILITEDNPNNAITPLAQALFGDDFVGGAMAFLTPGAEIDKGFTMEVTNKENVTFTLNGLTAIFKNVTPNDDGGECGGD
ncbi:MAG: hypothetical protein GX992_04720, partial [Clostridium sp.]|nr:hypothetical protein [Clostridium sp.]